MRKTLLKTGFIILCIGLIIFLLLPFLQTTMPGSSMLQAGQAQVATTSNPLTALVKRLAPLLGRKERAPQTFSARDALATVPPSTRLYPVDLSKQPARSAVPSEQKNEPSHTEAVSPTEPPFDYADASFKTDDGQWVLIRQIAPQSSTPGMHEVNVHENPYDRYVRQERALHFAPKAATQQSIPDSKWARLTQSFKNFIHRGDARPVEPTQVLIQRLENQKAALYAQADRLPTGAGDKTPSNRGRLSSPNITPQKWISLTEQERQELQEKQAMEDFSQLLSGEHAAKEAANLVAQAKYPNPNNKQEQQKKKELTERLIAENTQRIREAVIASIQANAQGKEPVDELSYMAGCKNASLPAPSVGCEETITYPQHQAQSLLEEAAKRNAENFFRTTKYPLPEGIPFTVIVGPTDPENFEDMEANPATAPIGKIYKSMYKQQQCDSRTCYWVPNSEQLDPSLADAFVTLGKAKLQSDPYNMYEPMGEFFVQEEIAQLGDQASPQLREETEKNARKQLVENRPNWVPYVEEQIVQMGQDKKQAIIVPDPAVAPGLIPLIDPLNFISNRKPLTEVNDSIEAGELFTDSAADRLNTVTQTVKEIDREAILQALSQRGN